MASWDAGVLKSDGMDGVVVVVWTLNENGWNEVVVTGLESVMDLVSLDVFTLNTNGSVTVVAVDFVLKKLITFNNEY